MHVFHIKIFSDITTVSLIVDEKSLCKVTRYEYLGVLIDQDLKMIPHVESMYKRANSKLGILTKIRRFITEKTAVKVYKTMIRPYLEYVDFIIESSSQEMVKKLDVFQRKALRRIEYCLIPEEKKSYEVLESKYKIEKLAIRRKRSLLRVMYINSKDINNIKNRTHDINLRSTKKVKMKEDFSGLTKLHRSPYYRGIKLWESLPETVQHAETKIIFKNEVKKNIIV